MKVLVALPRKVIANSHNFTDSSGPPIPVSDWLIFC